MPEPPRCCRAVSRQPCSLSRAKTTTPFVATNLSASGQRGRCRNDDRLRTPLALICPFGHQCNAAGEHITPCVGRLHGITLLMGQRAFGCLAVFRPRVVNPCAERRTEPVWYNVPTVRVPPWRQNIIGPLLVHAPHDSGQRHVR